jgi:hypothetical protein
MKMSRPMVTIIHRDNNAKEAAQLRHWVASSDALPAGPPLAWILRLQMMFRIGIVGMRRGYSEPRSESLRAPMAPGIGQKT